MNSTRGSTRCNMIGNDELTKEPLEIATNKVSSIEIDIRIMRRGDLRIIRKGVADFCRRITEAL